MKHVFDLDSVEHTATSVMTVRWLDRSNAPGYYGPQFETELDAEAAIANFGNLGLVFVPLIAAREFGRYPIGIMLDELIGISRLGTVEERSAAIRTIPNLRTEVIVPRDHWPLLVRFADLLAPASVQDLDPEDLFPNSGHRLRLLKSTLQVTRDARTVGIERVLPWLDGLETTLSGTKSLLPRGAAGDRLSQVHFRI